MADQYIAICEYERAEVIELPLEEDGTLLLSTLTGQFGSALGLKYRHPESKAMRGIRIADGKLHPPTSEGWVDGTYICVLPKENKRKSEDEATNSSPTKKRVESKRCVDLIVLGLPFSATDSDLREYFETFGEVLFANVKLDKSGQSKGYGFIRVASHEVQMKLLVQKHLINGRWCEVKIPGLKENSITPMTSKIFVGRCTENITVEDLSNYFSQFGEVINVYIPRPHRGFSFVTFGDPDTAEGLYGEDHIIKGISVYVTSPVARTSPAQKQNNIQNGGQTAVANENPANGNFGNAGPKNLFNNNDMLGAFNAMSPALIAAALSQAGLGAFNGTPQPRPLMEIAPQSLHNPGIFQNYRGRYNTPMGQDTEKQFMQQQRAPAPPAPYGNRVSGAPWNNNQQKSDQTWPSQISA